MKTPTKEFLLPQSYSILLKYFLHVSLMYSVIWCASTQLKQVIITSPRCLMSIHIFLPIRVMSSLGEVASALATTVKSSTCCRNKTLWFCISPAYRHGLWAVDATCGWCRILLMFFSHQWGKSRWPWMALFTRTTLYSGGIGSWPRCSVHHSDLCIGVRVLLILRWQCLSKSICYICPYSY